MPLPVTQPVGPPGLSMTPREVFAGQIMAAFCGYKSGEHVRVAAKAAECAVLAVRMADLLIAELEKGGPWPPALKPPE